MAEKKVIIATVIVVVVIVVTITGVAVNLLNKEHIQYLTDDNAIKVRTEQVFMLEDYKTLYIARDSHINVTVAPDALITVYANMSGRVSQVYVENGLPVRKGDKVLVFDAQEHVLQMQQAIVFNGTSKQMRDNAVDMYRTERENLKTEETEKAFVDKNISDRIIFAPNSGLIMNNSVRPGMYVERGTRLFDIANTDRVVLNFRIPCSQWNDTDKNSRVRIETERAFNGQFVFSGKIVNMVKAPYVEGDYWSIQVLLEDVWPRQGKAVKTEAGDSGSSFSQFQSAFNGGFSVYLPKIQASLVIPAEALLYNRGEPFVYVVDKNSVAEPRGVVVTANYGNDYYAISSGLNAGERVISIGQDKVYAGIKVEVVNE